MHFNHNQHASYLKTKLCLLALFPLFLIHGNLKNLFFQTKLYKKLKNKCFSKKIRFLWRIKMRQWKLYLYFFSEHIFGDGT